MTTNIETNKHDEDPSLSETENDQSFTSSADSESSSSCPFSTEICEKLTAAFAKATGIDVQFAAQLLNRHGWNIDEALAASYEATETMKNVDWKKEKEKFFRVLSWNVNLSDSDDEQINTCIEQRAEKIIEVLLREKPDVILLQQIGTLALTLLITSLSSLYDDESIQIDPSKNSDYVSILTKKSIVKRANVSIFEYEDHWRMLKMKILYKNSIPFDLFNTFFDTTTLTDQINSFCLHQIDDAANNHRSIVALSNVSQTTFQLTNLKTIGNSSEEETTSDRLLFRCSPRDDTEFNPIHYESFSIESDEILPRAHAAMVGYFSVLQK